MEYFDLGIEPRINIKESNNNHIDVEKENFRRIMKSNMESKAIFLINFSSVNKEGDLSIFYNGWRIIMPNKECVTLGNGQKGYNPQRRYFKLENQYHVIVTSIDEENGIIYVSHAQATRILRKTLATRIRNELKKLKKNRSNIVLPARITAVDDEQEFIVLDIAGFGISGIINRHNLRIGRTEKLSDIYKVGSEIDVCVYRVSKLSNSMNVFLCRENSLNREEGWKGISNRISVGDLLLVKCIRNTEKGSFVGAIEGERVSVLCIYPRYVRQNRTEDIQTGRYYRAVVIQVDEKKHSLICKIIANARKEHLPQKSSGLLENVENAYIAINSPLKTKDENTLDETVVERVLQDTNHSDLNISSEKKTEANNLDNIIVKETKE